MSLSPARTLIEQAVVWESAVGWTPECLDGGPAMLPQFQAAGFNFLSLTMAADWDRPEPALRHFAQQRQWFARRSERFRLVEKVADIHAAKATGQLAIGFHFQGAGPLAYDPALIELYYGLGLRWLIPCYNMRNPLGDGCHEPGNAGLSALGRVFVAEMNRVGMLIDASHAGERSALDMIEHSADPVIFSHSSVRSIRNHERNVSDALIDACAARGGVIGINGIGAFLSPDNSADVPTLVRHIDHVVQRVGPAHVGLGLDVVFYQDFMRKLYDSSPMMASRGYPQPPWADIKPQALEPLVDALLALGYPANAVMGVLGANFLRVAGTVWK